MSKPYDASTKFLIETFFPDWLALSPFPEIRKAEVIDSDLSTVTASADKVLRVFEPEPWILHLELQASRDAQMSKRLHWYNALLEYRHGLPVHTLVMLLRREADSPGLSGSFQSQLPGILPYRTFRFQVIRVWENKVQDFLTTGVGLLPLAPLTDEAGSKLPEVVSQIRTRLESEVSDRAMRGSLWTTTDVLMGLRYEPNFVAGLLQGVESMKESSTYQAIVNEGKREGLQEGKREGLQEGKREGLQEGKREGLQEGLREGMRLGAMQQLRETILRYGTHHLGMPSPAVRKKLDDIKELDELKTLSERLLNVNDWDELL